ncbi:hypothetical protein Tco_0626475 [Tanacetum coccineum]|uniref:Uncharacterized protein n=1 Tax=Tanacetum coccineum TaxID=301880 RepID=A0ABQ4WJP8_9ASTR
MINMDTMKIKATKVEITRRKEDDLPGYKNDHKHYKKSYKKSDGGFNQKMDQEDLKTYTAAGTNSSTHARLKNFSVRSSEELQSVISNIGKQEKLHSFYTSKSRQARVDKQETASKCRQARDGKQESSSKRRQRASESVKARGTMQESRAIDVEEHEGMLRITNWKEKKNDKEQKHVLS